MRAPLAFVLGSAHAPEKDARTVWTPFGPVLVVRCGGRDAVLRHGWGLPPHRVDPRSTAWALRELGADGVVGVASTGSLRPDWPPGLIVVPSGHINLWSIPSFYEARASHAVSGLDGALRARLLSAAAAVVPAGGLRDGGVYVQTRGPRFETPDEVRILASWGDLVGMTAGAECDACAELDLPYAMLCTVDNLANGLAPLDEPTVRAAMTRTRGLVDEILRRL